MELQGGRGIKVPSATGSSSMSAVRLLVGRARCVPHRPTTPRPALLGPRPPSQLPASVHAAAHPAPHATRLCLPCPLVVGGPHRGPVSLPARPLGRGMDAWTSMPSLPPPQHPPHRRGQRPGRTSRGGVNEHHARAQGKSTPRTCTAATVGPSVDSADHAPHVAAHSPPCGVHRPHAPHVAPDTVCRGHICPPCVLVPHTHKTPTRVAPGNAVPDAHQPQTNTQVKEKVDVTQRIRTREEHVPATPPPRRSPRSADIAFLKH